MSVDGLIRLNPRVSNMFYRYSHRRSINTEEKAKVVAAVCRTYLNAALAICPKDDLKKILWKNIHLGRVVVGVV